MINKTGSLYYFSIMKDRKGNQYTPKWPYYGTLFRIAVLTLFYQKLGGFYVNKNN